MTLVSAHGEELLLARRGDEFFVLDSVCSHALGYLDQGTLVGCEIECPLHDGRFDLRTGRATRDPAVDPIRAYQVRVEGTAILVGPAKS